MSYIKRLDNAFRNAPVLPVTPNTKYVFFSDCHRGTRTEGDNFQKNEELYLHALQYYNQRGFTYIEVGDGDELWENTNLSEIQGNYENVFTMLSRFQKAGRFHTLYGNHDMIKKSEAEIQEALIFQPCNLYVAHGHQADFWNSTLWRFTRFLVRYLWTPLESFGITDPTSASKCTTRCSKVEQNLIRYAKEKNCILLCGHTHKPGLGNAASPYHNCGSCVKSDGITCIELEGSILKLIRWNPNRIVLQ